MSGRKVKFSDVDTVYKFHKNTLTTSPGKKYTNTKRTKYDPHNCEICKISCNSKKIYDMHVVGKRHLKALEKFTESMFLCDKCSKTFDNLESWSKHLTSIEHILAEQTTFSAHIFENVNQKDVLNSINYCKICNLDCGSNIILQSHLTGTKHKKRLKLLKIEKLIEEKDSSVYCDICEISLEPELMLMHKQSNKHKKKNVKENSNVNMSKSKSSMVHCVMCNHDFKLITEALEHYQSDDHNNRVKNSEHGSLWCDVCKILLPNLAMLDVHLKGFRHYRILNREESSVEGSYKDKILNKKEKQRQLKEKFVKEKEDLEEENYDEIEFDENF